MHDFNQGERLHPSRAGLGGLVELELALGGGVGCDADEDGRPQAGEEGVVQRQVYDSGTAAAAAAGYFLFIHSRCHCESFYRLSVPGALKLLDAFTEFVVVTSKQARTR